MDNIEIEFIKNIIEESCSLADVIRNLKWSISGTNYKKLRKLIEEEEIDISHFKNGGEITYENSMKNNRFIPMEEILVENSKYSRGGLKKRLKREGIIEYKCDICDRKIYLDEDKEEHILYL